MSTSAVELKRWAADAVEDRRGLVVGISRALHADPETAFDEHRAAALLTDALAELGMTVSRGAGGLPTAFTATTGTGSLHVAIVAEYDALAGLGHACGHNVIAAAAVGAASALAPLADELGLTLTVVGAPAEEGGGGKVMLLEAGVFDGVDIAMMVHPGPADSVYARPLAVAHLDVAYRGRETHAAAYPTLGINAADAFTVAQVAIGLLRQQLPPSVRVHGIVREAGSAPNAIPGSALGSWYVRAATLEELEEVYPRVMACFEAGALATGCTVDLQETSHRYSEFHNDEDLVAAFARNAAARGRDMDLDEVRPGGMNTASTDMGNVSRVVRAIHPYLSIGSLPAVNHQEAFADAAGTPAAEEAAVEGAILMAQTVIDAARHHDSPLPCPEKEHTHAHTR
ncbi:amidohydrolase [Microbacterium sp. zg.Y1090]|uniref:amidohydrolase n=1 Tax=Microbacterium TaxID=33882 RepID=UPI00214CD46D|nr:MULTISPECIES: amidohydrolase [unclassified Microbacterium]MCR2812714.1 amidohydrolase [Microbacterium sp. zg.Y1084]MCR2817492.1 amidohydrolase [Microbacterium sp. zg.Y1090]MDL5485866.1 amidohydrolase [Microbacterium sp. zg-Y1211]WIM29025.1 amidohydrolase [Microbacterium sp. zg-Y1090]